MERLLYPLLFLILVSFAGNVPPETRQMRITEQSAVFINGTSNVTDFRCEYNINKLDRKIPLRYHVGTDAIHFEKANLLLQNVGFDCGGKGINKDFHSLLQSDAYPTILFQLRKVQKLASAPNKAKAYVEIQIAGVNRCYTMEATYSQKDKEWRINGQLKLDITDFELKAPKKMLGLIVVSETITIDFDLYMVDCL